MPRLFASLLLALIGFTPAFAQRGLNMNTPRPIAALDSVWIEELTWMEVRDAIQAGKTTAIIAAASNEQNGPYVPTAKHAYVLRATAEAVARKLGNALIAPIIQYEPGRPSNVPGTIAIREEIYTGLIADVANSLKANGFKNIILIGDSGGNQSGLQKVETQLSSEWAGSGTNIYFIREYYNSWEIADQWVEDHVQKSVSEGIHDDFSVNSIIMTVDPEKIRFDQRVAAGKASINGISITPAEHTLEVGRKLVDMRAEATVEAIRKRLGSN